MAGLASGVIVLLMNSAVRDAVIHDQYCAVIGDVKHQPVYTRSSDGVEMRAVQYGSAVIAKTAAVRTAIARRELVCIRP